MTTTAITPDTSVLAIAGFCRTDDARGFEHEGLEPNQNCVVVERGGLAAVAACVPTGYFDGPTAEQRLGDVQWVGPRAVAHDTIIRALMARGPVVPSGFGSAFSGVDAVGAFLDANAATLLGTLNRFNGAVELGVRVRTNLNAAELELRDRLMQETPLPASPGARYLAEKKLRRRAETEANQWACSVAEQASRPLVSIARGAVTRTIRPTDNDDLPTIANWAFLVEESEREVFDAAISAAFPDQRVFRVELSGPWPPFSFVPELASA
ncbi:MAG: GvpL/GvpF family gas vesicle protein [Planctomycetota bacterium]